MDLLIETLTDTLKMVPLLIITFVVIELFEHRVGKNFDERIKRAGKLGPLVGAVLGVIPQCGFSVMAVAFYSQSLITTGTLISIFIATSDEALPVLISSPGAATEILPFVVTKVGFAVLWGYIIDYFLRKKKIAMKQMEEAVNDGCCSDECIYTKFDFKEILYHSLTRTFKIAGYIFTITLIIGGVIKYTGIGTLTSNSLSASLFQPVIASAIGLIPNCAVSVGLVQLYLFGGITFSSVIAGLSSNAGMGLLVLFKEVENKREAILITLILFICSAITGIILHII